MRRAARVDSNQAVIASAFRGMGCSVEILSAVGRGVPDLLVGVDSYTIPVEVKDGTNPLTPDQIKWHRDWRGSKAIVRNLEDVGLIVRAIRGLAGRSARKKEKKNATPANVGNLALDK